MAGTTLGKHLMGAARMWQTVAVATCLNLSVFGVAEGTTQTMVLSGTGSQLLYWSRMAGLTMLWCNIPIRPDKGLMRQMTSCTIFVSRVADGAISYAFMGSHSMATGTFWNIVRHAWAMTLMTV